VGPPPLAAPGPHPLAFLNPFDPAIALAAAAPTLLRSIAEPILAAVVPLLRMAHRPVLPGQQPTLNSQLSTLNRSGVPSRPCAPARIPPAAGKSRRPGSHGN
jgi:hypothetical protein